MSGFRRAGAAAFLVLLTGCTGGTETGNPPFTAALAYTGTSSAPKEYAIGERGSVATVQGAWLDLEAVELSPEGTCAGDGQALSLPALGIGDHAAGAHVKTTFEAHASSFCTFTLPFTRALRVPAVAPPDLQGRSLLLLGELADGTPFRIASDAEPRFALQPESAGIELSSEERSLLVAFDFAAWLRAVPFEEATHEGGAVLIDNDHNAELLTTFDAALGAGVALYRDPNADGVLDDDAELLARPR